MINKSRRSYIGPQISRYFHPISGILHGKTQGFFPPEENMKKMRPIWRMPLLHSLVPSWVSPRSPPLRKVLRVWRMVPRQAVSAGVGSPLTVKRNLGKNSPLSRCEPVFFWGKLQNSPNSKLQKCSKLHSPGGLAPLVTGLCFLLAIPFAPVVSAVPPLASGPILCLLGALMCSSVRGIDWDDYQEPEKNMFWGCTFQFNTKVQCYWIHFRIHYITIHYYSILDSIT